MKRYNPKDIEQKWQKTWEQQGLNKTSEDPAKPKQYILEFFPYPSGSAMHVGHVRNYAIGDVLARFARMTGHNVLHPMGWDGFGLPAENYAIKTSISPRQAIDENTGKFKQQLTQMGFGYDWTREIDSTDPAYYKWTQWFFLLLFKKGLAYQQESLQWWCPVDQTVLANEQVEAGKCWRCGSEVIKKPLKQWFFKITDYADRLAKDLDDVNWSDSIKAMQRNWIGRSRGAEVDFPVADTKSDQKIAIFTTRPDTLYGATFMVLAPEHPLVKTITTADQKPAVDAYVKQTLQRSEIDRMDTDREKTGVFTGAYAVNPVNNKKIPIWIADYVLTGYGTGAIMAVPAHDQRDNQFAKIFNLPITPVIEPVFGEPQGDDIHQEKIIAIVRNPKNDQILVLDWGPRQARYGGNMLIGGSVEDGEDVVTAARREITEETGYTNLKLIEQLKTKGHGYFYSNVKDNNYCGHCTGLLFELTDDQATSQKLDEGEKNKFTAKWVAANKVASILDDGIHETFYRQLMLGECYHGEGRMINSGPYDGRPSAEVRDQIIADLAKKGLGQEKINYRMRDWLISRQRYWGAPIPIIHCAKCGVVPVPDGQLPVILPEVKSYEPSGDGHSPLANVPDFVNTACPKCGGPAKRETDTMDGFACSSWYFLRFADPHNTQAAFSKDKADFWLPVDTYIGGAEHAVMHLLYARFWTKVMYDEGLINFSEPFTTLRNHGMILAPDGQKMSKSKGNVIAPEELIEQGYGADSIRIMELFIGPWNQSAAWSIEGLGGTFRFLQRVWTLVQEYLEGKPANSQPTTSDATAEPLQRATHQTIKKVSVDMHNMGFNTAVSALMELTNQLYKIKAQNGFADKDAWEFALNSLVQLLAPYAPHITEELWQQLGHTESVHISTWPLWDDSYLQTSTVNIVVQVNGKLRAQLTMPSDSDEQTTVQAARTEAKIAPQLQGREVKKTIYVPGKLVNFVI